MALTNEQKLQAVIKGASQLISIEAQYRIGKFILQTDDEVNIPAAKITALKQKFAAVRTQIIDYLNSITP